MKHVFQKLCNAGLKLIPVCTAFILTVCSNSTATWVRGQDELPANAKRYRKF